MTEILYEERVVGYADIIGWKDACGRLTEIERVYAAVKDIQKHADNFLPPLKDLVKDPQHSSAEFSFFSDNFVVSAPVEHGEIVLNVLSWACYNLLHSYKFLTRGAVTIGKVYHHERIVFGPALSNAVDMEKNAKFPRLMCSENVIEQFQKQLPKYFLKDHHGEWILNIARGSTIAENEIMSLIDCETKKTKDALEKWSYAKDILPVMHRMKE